MSDYQTEGIALPESWWEHCSGVMRFGPKMRGETIRDIINRLDEAKDWGFDAINMGVPYHGGIQYGGLDVIDYYSVDPAIGAMDDLQELIRLCHEKGLAIIAAFNFGYAAMEFPPFLKACDDVKAGVDSREVHWFLWSDTGTEELDRSHLPFFRNDITGYWHYSERARKYYWVNWPGQDREVNMPQFHFGDPAWQEECKRVVRFWMDTGIDGMVIDAVNWYLNCDWEINNATMTDIVRAYPNKFVQPEGAGGFKDDPVPWITKGKYNCLQDYEMACWWAGHNVIAGALESGNPTAIERALRVFRDRVVAAGGVTWLNPGWRRGGLEQKFTPAQKLLEAVTLATEGELLVGSEMMLDLPWPKELTSKLKEMIRAVRAYSALQATGARKKLLTNNDTKYYAFMRTSKDEDQKVLVILNFQPNHRRIRVRLEEPARLTDIFTQKQTSVNEELEVALPPYGYGIYLLR